MNKTKIDWADSTWNPVTGCLHECEYCYARRIARRFAGYLKSGSYSGGGGKYALDTPCYKLNKKCNYEKAPYPFGFEPTFHRYRLEEPMKKKKPQNIFVCSMADLFGEWVPDEWIQEVFKACEDAPQHRYLFLTKNPSRYNNFYSFHDNRPKNLFFGTTATTYGDTVAIRRTFAKSLNFLSVEPILDDISHGLSKMFYEEPNRIKWVIIGAETGNRKGKVIPKKEWIDNITGQCKAANVPVFMKESLRELMGDDFIQEYPWEV